MNNRKVLIDALKKLGAAKAPTNKKDIIVDPDGQWAHPGEITRIPSNTITMSGVPYPVLGKPNVGQPQMMYPGQDYQFPDADYVDEFPMEQPDNYKKGGETLKKFVTAKEGVDTPIYKQVSVKKSKIAGKGLFTDEPIQMGEPVGISHVRKVFEKNGEMYQAPFPSTVLGYYNHSEEPNVREVDNGDHIVMVATRDIKPNEELTSNYDISGIKDLETSENFKKGGSAPKLPKKNNPPAYSRSLEATNRLLAEHPFFAQAKSRKNKIYDPKSKYFEDGGAYYDDSRDAWVYADGTVGPNGPANYQDGGSPYVTNLSSEDESKFQKFYQTLPENLQQDDPSYDMRGYWDSEGRPSEFDYSQPKEDDGYYHAYSINQNTGKYLKAPWHPTFQHAVEEDRKVGYRPTVNVKGEVIATENPALMDEYVETELTPEEIQEYAKGGYIIEDISVPELTKASYGKIVQAAGNLGKVASKAQVDDLSRYAQNAVSNIGTVPLVGAGQKINEINLSDLRDITRMMKQGYGIGNLTDVFEYPLTINGDSGFLTLKQNHRDINKNLWHFSAFMDNPREAGLAFSQMNELFPLPKPSILEPTSLSMDSFNMLTNMGRRSDWTMTPSGTIRLNGFAKHNNLFEGLTPLKELGQTPQSHALEYEARINDYLKEKGLQEKALMTFMPLSKRNGEDIGITHIELPNYKLTRHYSDGGSYELGDEVDEATMKELEKLGYTFEKL
jgi:hypothetical protein